MLIESLMRSFKRNVFQLNKCGTPSRWCAARYLPNNKKKLLLSYLAASWDSLQTLMSCYDRRTEGDELKN